MYKFLKIIILIIFLLFNNQNSSFAENDKIKIGLLVPLTGENKNIGQQIVKATRMALKDINENNLEIYLKDTNSNPDQTFRSALEFQKMGIKIVIGPIFFKSLSQLEEIQEITFLSFTNRTLSFLFLKKFFRKLMFL